MFFRRLSSLTKILRRTTDENIGVQLHRGNQQSIEEIIEQREKTRIENLYEFEKLDIKQVENNYQRFRHPIKRGQTGVFDLDQILDILRDERMQDICVIEIPPQQQYARYLVLATAFSARHLKNTSEYINQLYKAKKNESEPFLSSECREGSKWHAMDMGYLVLHLMDEDIREQTDLETLWCVGPKFDDQIHEIQKSLEAIRKLDEQLKQEELLTVAAKYRPLDNPHSHVRHPLEGPGIFQDPPPRKEKIRGDIAHKKHQFEQIDPQVEKRFSELPSDPKPPVYDGQKIN